MKVIELELFKFDELPDNVQQSVIENWRYGCDDFEFESQCTIDDCKEIANLIGIEIDNIYYSGFSYQGDGACFEGAYSYSKGALKRIKEYAPFDTELHDITQALQDLQSRHFYQLSASVKHKGHYHHEYCTRITTYKNNDYIYNEALDSDIEHLEYLLRSFMQWIYTQLQQSFDNWNSEEYIRDEIIANEYDFDIYGVLK